MKYLVMYALLTVKIVFASAISACNAMAQPILKKDRMLTNGVELMDTRGQRINAHGGGFLKEGEYFYWIGENRNNDVLVSCYRSKDLVNWEFRGDLLTRKSNTDLANANIERPKVIYNDATKQYVMWMHYEMKSDYSYARAAIATAGRLEGPYTYCRSFRPLGNMSRDCTLFKDDDGRAYFISSTRENRDMNVYELTADYMDVKEKVHTLWPGALREAPALAKIGKRYFMLTSYCTGWEPNQAMYAFADSIKGEWSSLRCIGSPTTFDTQPTFIIPVSGTTETSYLYVGDRWNPTGYFSSTYVFLPIVYINDTTITMNWVREIRPDIRRGCFATSLEPPTQYRIKSQSSGMYLGQGCQQKAESCIIGRRLDYADDDLRWELVPDIKGNVKLRHAKSGKYLTVKAKNRINLSSKGDSAMQQWIMLKDQNGMCRLVSYACNSMLSMRKYNGNAKEVDIVRLDDECKMLDKDHLFLLAPIYE